MTGSRESKSSRPNGKGTTMDKIRTKKIPFNTTATEVEPGVWTWQVGGRDWKMTGLQGINLSANSEYDADDFMRISHIPDLKSAGYFSSGFTAGFVKGFSEGRDYVEPFNDEWTS
jgi:hypothetical protein